MQEFLQASVDDARDLGIAERDAFKKRFVSFKPRAVVLFKVAHTLGKLRRHAVPEGRKGLGGKRMRRDEKRRFGKGLGKDGFHVG